MWGSNSQSAGNEKTMRKSAPEAFPATAQLENLDGAWCPIDDLKIEIFGLWTTSRLWIAERTRHHPIIYSSSTDKQYLDSGRKVKEHTIE
jgi:hypothetical protein